VNDVENILSGLPSTSDGDGRYCEIGHPEPICIVDLCISNLFSQVLIITLAGR
jgi:hypothetical protein